MSGETSFHETAVGEEEEEEEERRNKIRTKGPADQDTP